MELVPLDLGSRLVPYEEAWEAQRELHARVVAGHAPDTVLLVEHASVYTAGRRTAAWDRPIDGTPVVDVDRGGKITWHGPGQLVAYPVLRLAEPVDVVAYVRALEDAVMAVCADLGLATVRSPGRSGVWIPAQPVPVRKLAAIGVRVAKGVTMHGLALNCDCDLVDFGRIVPCGLPDSEPTSLTAELGRRVTVADAAELLAVHLPTALAHVRAATARERTVPA